MSGTVANQRTVDLYRDQAKSLIAYASALVGRSDAEDLVADAMVRVFARVDLGQLANPKAYLFRCVLNQARSRGRSNRARRERERSFARRPVVEPAPMSADELGALRCLSARERAVVFLTYWEDLTVADVAECLGLSDGTVRRYLARARHKLRRELQP
jgi:RNA polymerase sigma-70 factor (ECF subfamily)